MTGLSLLVLVLAAAVTQPGGPETAAIRGAVFEEPAAAASIRDAATISLPADATWAEFFEAAGVAGGLRVFINWPAIHRQFDAERIGPTASIGQAIDGFGLEEALQLLNERLGGEAFIDVRCDNERLIFATRHSFDVRERVLVSYDLTDLVAARHEDSRMTVDEIRQLVVDEIMALVDPPIWMENGGDLGYIRGFHTSLFIVCPARVLPRIEWVIDQMLRTVGGELPGPPVAAGQATISLEGAVPRPGEYALAAETPLRDFLDAFGGDIPQASWVRVVRGQGWTESIALRISAAGLRTAAPGFRLHPGDRIVVE